jgi:ubiquinone/menaquinone biosynthesis C-methylase UbiE
MKTNLAANQRKWDCLAPRFDVMAGEGGEKRWRRAKTHLFSAMGDGDILFMALGTGQDIGTFPPSKTLHAIDVSERMLSLAQPRVEAYNGTIHVRQMDIHQANFAPESFDQVFTSCTFCSVPEPVEGLKQVFNLLRPGGELLMFEHTGSGYFPFNLMLRTMTFLTNKIGPDMDRNTVANVKAAGFEVVAVENVFLDVVKIIRAKRPKA